MWERALCSEEGTMSTGKTTSGRQQRGGGAGGGGLVTLYRSSSWIIF